MDNKEPCCCDKDKECNEQQTEENIQNEQDTKAPDNIEDTKTEDAKTSKADKKKAKKLDAELQDLTKKLEQKEAEYKAIDDKYMRMMAEYDNFRKRSAKEKEGIYADAYADAVKNLLPILDNLQRATAFKEAEAVIKGVEMTLKGVEEVFEKMGIVAFGEAGETFDPNKHNAVMHIEDEAAGEGVIVEVFQKGYSKNDKILRYAMVKVAN